MTVYVDAMAQTWVLAWIRDDEIDERAGDMPVPLDRLGSIALRELQIIWEDP
jgi:hypothetical protein